MKIALAYDWLNQKNGGGEATLFEIAKLYPTADIYCLLYNKKKFSKYFPNRNITVSRLRFFPEFIKKRPNLLLPFVPSAVNHLDFTGYDLVISVSSAWVKNITVPHDTIHISYCFSPARMIWDSWPGYLEYQKIGPFKLGAISKFFITKRVSKIRLWDYYSSKNVSEFIAISDYVAQRIQKFYGLSSTVVYPPVKLEKINIDYKEDYYLVLSVLSRYKNIELVIRTFIKNHKKLIIAGDGPDRSRLEQLAKNNHNISFVGRVDETTKNRLLARARAFIFASKEDFGIAPVEAQNAGTPVIAIRGGGLNETIDENKTGVFFEQSTTEDLQDAIERFEKMKFNPKILQHAAVKFNAKQFDVNFVKAIADLTKESSND